MKRLVLLGGGHAQIHVLAALAKQPLPGWDVQLVSPHRRLIYSGMLPGWMAGHYPIERCAIALEQLASSAGVTFHETAGTGLDLAKNELRCADGRALRFDVLAIDTCPMSALQKLAIASDHALQIRPIERFMAAWPALTRRIQASTRRFDLVVLGAGAAGVELAFAIRRRASVEGWSHLALALVGPEGLPLAGAPLGARQRAARLLAERSIGWLGSRRATQVDDHSIRFESGELLSCDACLIATGTAAPSWPAAAGLATDKQGFIRVARTLQSVSHPHVFAAGDVAAYADARPKSGVFAVRAGPVLADNLRAYCEDRALRAWTPQTRALVLISAGDGHALATWGGWWWSGRWVWRWKDRIDRQFVRRFGTTAPSPTRQSTI